MKKIDWSEVSWRAIVPLYEKGYCKKYDMDATVDLISNMGVSEEQVLNYDEALMKLHDQQNEFHRIQQKNILSDYHRDVQHLQDLLSQKRAFEDKTEHLKGKELKKMERQIEKLNDLIAEAIAIITKWRIGTLHPKRLPEVIVTSDGKVRSDAEKQL